MSTFYKKVSEALIDPSKHQCPNNKKHTLRLSSDRRYSDLWCDTCKNGWTASSIQQIIENKCSELLVSCSDYDYVAVYMKITKAVKEELQTFQKTVKQMNSRHSMMVPVSSMTNSNFALAISRIDFEGDKDNSYKSIIEDKLEDNSILEVPTLKHKLDLKSCHYDNLKDLDGSSPTRGCYLIINQAGVKIECQYENLITPVIPWNKLIVD